MALRQRLLRDIAELQAKPYPNVTLFPNETVTTACLVLTPNGGRPIHLAVDFGFDYPLRAPVVTIQSRHIEHPNVFGSYICASILNTEEGYTSAYTLKGIAIQLLSFFSSDRIEQDYGGSVDLTSYRESSPSGRRGGGHLCNMCEFGKQEASASSSQRSEAERPEETNDEAMIDLPTAAFPTLGSRARRNLTSPTTSSLCPRDAAKWHDMIQPALPLTSLATQPNNFEPTTPADVRLPTISRQLASLPDEILLLICNELDTEELFVFARSWDRIGGEEGIMTRFDVIRTRELQCFCLKKSFSERGVQLGVGVNVVQRGRQGTIESEFDLLSLQAYKEFGIRRSVQGLRFQHWLPLPISPRHFDSVKDEVNTSTSRIGTAAKLDSPTPVNVIYHFMNDVVVKLSQEASKSFESPSYMSYGRHQTPQSTLKHASEKAIDSYFHLFHLLLCLASPAVVQSANSTIQAFLSGQISKTTCPNLGHLLIAVLISDTETTQELTMAIVKETITRNVVWMLDTRGAGMAELSYMEASAVSDYRLQKTFEASKTSYRLLMFLNLLRLTTNKTVSVPHKTMSQLRDEMFDRHGAPPKGAATRLANDIKRIHAVNTFPDFLQMMGIQKMPTKQEFTAFLRRTVEESMAKGYSVWGLSQEKALALRRIKEPNVEARKTQDCKPEWRASKNGGGFFPGKGRR